MFPETLNEPVTRAVFARWDCTERQKIPLSSFALCTVEAREAFIEEYFAWGEEILFEAVLHIWNSLNEPRHWRCTQMGLTAGTGSTGKKALINLLRRALREALDSGIELPKTDGYDSVEDWHRAAMFSMKADHDHFDLTVAKYATLLGGSSAKSSKTTVVLGPWSGPPDEFGAPILEGAMEPDRRS